MSSGMKLNLSVMNPLRKTQASSHRQVELTHKQSFMTPRRMCCYEPTLSQKQREWCAMARGVFYVSQMPIMACMHTEDEEGPLAHQDQESQAWCTSSTQAFNTCV